MPVAEGDNIVDGFDELALGGLIGDDGLMGNNSNELPAITFTDQADADEEDKELTPATSTKPTKPIVGIIYPPPEVRNIVDKTATFVARNGPEFEVRIRQNEQNNPKFNFLNKDDPYHVYYQHKVKEIQEGKSSSAATSGPNATSFIDTLKSAGQLIDEAKKKTQADLLRKVELPFVPKDPPSEFEFIADPPSISAHDLDVVKLTALFVARNGRQFLSTLMNREQRNYQFDFLRPQHSLFQYFTKLLDQYTKVLIPPKDITKKLGSEDKTKILEDVKYRSNWIRHQEVERRKLEEAAERERLAYASIDWHDFVVVETVDYQPFEQGQFPPPTTPQEVGARVLLQDRILQGQNVGKEQPGGDDDEQHYQTAGADIIQVQDMEEESDTSSDEDDYVPESKKSDDAEQYKQLQAAFEPPKEDQVIIKKDYDPKRGPLQQEKVIRSAAAAGPKPEEYTISPITGERIPVSKLQEHMRIGLLDPRWRDQRDRQMMEKVNQESVYAPGLAIESQLKQLAERRSDIFGVGGEERPIGKKVGDAEIWDSGAPPSTSILTGNDDDGKFDEGKKEKIGPSLDSAHSQPQPPGGGGMPPQPPHSAGILQAPPQPPLPQLPGIIRQAQPPPPPGVMMMNMNRVGIPPLLGMQPPQQHQFSPYPPQAHSMPQHQHRPPLLTSAPPVLPPMQQPPPSMQIPPPQQPPPVLPPAPVEEEPAAKKAKTLEDTLIPESQFLATNKSPVSFIVAVPSMPEKPELNLNGQIISVTEPLTDFVSVLKAKIQEVIGLAPNKQKLNLTEGLFFKDSNSLAYYNIGEGATIHLSIKERGGRKK